MQRSKRAVYMIDQSDAWHFWYAESAARDYQNDHEDQTGPTRKYMVYQIKRLEKIWQTKK